MLTVPHHIVGLCRNMYTDMMQKQKVDLVYQYN